MCGGRVTRQFFFWCLPTTTNALLGVRMFRWSLVVVCELVLITNHTPFRSFASLPMSAINSSKSLHSHYMLVWSVRPDDDAKVVEHTIFVKTCLQRYYRDRTCNDALKTLPIDRTDGLTSIRDDFDQLDAGHIKPHSYKSLARLCARPVFELAVCIKSLIYCHCYCRVHILSSFLRNLMLLWKISNMSRKFWLGTDYKYDR